MPCDQRTGKYLISCGAKIMTPIRDVFFSREGINLRREIGMKYNECEIMTGQVDLGPQM